MTNKTLYFRVGYIGRQSRLKPTLLKGINLFALMFNHGGAT